MKQRNALQHPRPRMCLLPSENTATSDVELLKALASSTAVLKAVRRRRTPSSVTGVEDQDTSQGIARPRILGT